MIPTKRRVIQNTHPTGLPTIQPESKLQTLVYTTQPSNVTSLRA